MSSMFSYVAAVEPTPLWIYFALAMLGLYFFALVLSYIMLTSPEMRRKGETLLPASGLLPLVAALELAKEGEHLLLTFHELLLVYSPWSYISIFLASWLTLSFILYRFIQMFGKALKVIILIIIVIIIIIAVDVGATAASHIILLIFREELDFLRLAVLSLFAAVLLLHLYIARRITKTALHK
ncbi:MAG: hypothetical protein QXZ31_10585 [Thermofilaceae archaeon]